MSLTLLATILVAIAFVLTVYSLFVSRPAVPLDKIALLLVEIGLLLVWVPGLNA